MKRTWCIKASASSQLTLGRPRRLLSWFKVPFSTKNSPPSNRSRTYAYLNNINKGFAGGSHWRTRPPSSWHSIFGFLARRILRRLVYEEITPYRLKAPKISASDATRGATHTWKNHAGPNWHRIGTARTTHARECNDSICHDEPRRASTAWTWWRTKWWRGRPLTRLLCGHKRNSVVYMNFKGILKWLRSTDDDFWDKLPQNDDFAIHGADHDEWYHHQQDTSPLLH